MSQQKAGSALAGVSRGEEEQRRSLSSLLYTFPNLDWETAHSKPEAGAWAPAWGRSSPAEGSSMPMASGEPSLGSHGLHHSVFRGV